MFQDFIARWDLIPAGEPIRSRSSALLPVTWRGAPAMLKIALIDEERRGASLMQAWAGKGAARVLASEGDGVLLERATGERSLATMSASGEDDEATRTLCSVVHILHQPAAERPVLMPLTRWFQALDLAAAPEGGMFADCARVAAELLEREQEVVALHGDIHHDNVLDFGERGWLAIDPKGLIGDRAFDYANLFHNPDASAADPNRFDRRLAIVCGAAGLDRVRLLKWIMAWSGLSAAFSLEDGEPPDPALEIARLAATRLQDSP